MKKIFIIGSSIIFIILLTWLYQAFKFEQDISNKYLPILEKYKENISYESIAIDKFKFKITINKIKLVSKTKLLSFCSDKLIVKKVPYSNSVYIDSYGGEGKSTLSEDVLYAPHHHISVVINKPTFGKVSEDLSIDIDSDKFKLFDAKNDRELLNFDNYDLNIKHSSENKDNNVLHVNSVGKNVRLSAVFEQFFILEVLKLFPHLESFANSKQQYSQDYYHFLYKFDELTKAAMNDTELTMAYPKELLGQMYELIKSEQPYLFESIVEKISEKDFNISIVNRHEDKLHNGIFNLKLLNNENFKLDFVSNYNYNYNSDHKSKMTELFADYYQKIANRDLNRFINKGSEPVVFSEEDFTKLFVPILNIRNLNLVGSFDHSKKDGAFSHMLECKLNNFAFKFQGKNNNSLYSGEINVDRPQDLLKFTTNYAKEGLQPLVKRIGNENISNQFVRIVKTIDEFGLPALNALSSVDLTTEPSIFLMKLEGNKSLQNIMINNKDAMILLNDERIQTFLQSLTSEESLEKIKNTKNE